MQIPVVIEKVEKNGYRASSGSPFDLSAEGATREEAKRRLRELIVRRLGTDSVVESIDVSDSSSPWFHPDGYLDPKDPLVIKWKKIMARNRRKADKAAGL